MWLGAAGALTSVVPTFRLASAMTDADEAVEEGCKPATGRIFLRANVKIERNGVSKGEEIQGIIAVDPETGQWEKILDGDRVRVSRDGKALAVARSRASNSSMIESADIWKYDLASRRETQIAAEAGTMFCWSPDGNRIVIVESRFTKDDRSQDTTEQINLDGSGRTRLPIPETDEVDDWSPDGKWFVAVTNRKPPFGRGYQLYRMHPDGSEELQLTKNGLNCYPRFSPDSQKIVYLHQTAKDGNSLHVMDVDGKNDHEILREEGLKSVYAGCFSPDGRRLVVTRFDWHLDEKGEKTLGGAEDNSRLEVMDADGKNRRLLPLVGAKVKWLGHPDWR